MLYSRFIKFASVVGMNAPILNELMKGIFKEATRKKYIEIIEKQKQVELKE